MPRAIFISYRRDDSEGETGRLFDDLVRTFGDDSVFMDVAGIDPGTDFRTAIDSNVASCGVLLAILGPRWATIPSPAGTPRLDDPNDFVRLEIASALKRNIPVIPVLVHEAKMPHPDQLPDALKDLAYRNSVEITHARWNSDVQLLTKALAQYVNATRATDMQPVHATVSVQLPAPYDVHPSRPDAARSRLPLYGALGLLAVLAAGLVAFLVLRLRHPASSPMVGTWTRTNSNGNNRLSRLDIRPGPDARLYLHAWGNCQPLDCDWGTQTATVVGDTATAAWPSVAPDDILPNTHSAGIEITPQDGNLKVHLQGTGPHGGHSDFSWLFVRSQR